MDTAYDIERDTIIDITYDVLRDLGSAAKDLISTFDISFVTINVTALSHLLVLIINFRDSNTFNEAINYMPSDVYLKDNLLLKRSLYLDTFEIRYIADLNYRGLK